MPIRFVPRDEIDDCRWDEIVENDPSGFPYAYSWYLDIVAPLGWMAMIEGDYQRILPIPYNRKLFGLAQVYQPVLSQQYKILGSPADSTVYAEFLNLIESRFSYVHYPVAVPTSDLSSYSDHTERSNLLIELDAAYPIIREGYNKSLKKNLRVYGPQQNVSSTDDIPFLVGFYKKEMEQRTGLSSKQYQIIQRLLSALQGRGMLQILQSKTEEGELLAMGAFVRTRTRVINVFGASTNRGRELRSMHCLLDRMIEQNAESSKIFDFEGSDLKGIKEFFLSFGSYREPYLIYHSNRLPLPIRLLKR